MVRRAVVLVLAAIVALLVPGIARADTPAADVSVLDDVFAPGIVRIHPGQAV